MIMSTMLTTPLNNLVRFTKVRPPLVIFVLCLIVITLSCFWFAFYIDHDYGVLNNDEQQVSYNYNTYIVTIEFL